MPVQAPIRLLTLMLRRPNHILANPLVPVMFCDYDYEETNVGFDAESLSPVEIANANANSQLFGHIRLSSGEESTCLKSTATRSPRTDISEGLDITGVLDAVLAALTRKLSRLVAFDGLHQKVDSSMAELGLDSLITTELKTWIFTEFQAAMHVSDILDQANIRSLASLIASRSNLVQEKIESLSHEQNECRNELRMSAEVRRRFLTGEKATSSSNALPALPLPELDSSLRAYLESRRYFLSEEEYAHTSKIITEFLQDDGFGRELQGRLEARLRDSDIDN